jgi:hypothetical protein
MERRLSSVENWYRLPPEPSPPPLPEEDDELPPPNQVVFAIKLGTRENPPATIAVLVLLEE